MLTINYRASRYDTAAATSYATTGTYSPAANALLICLVVGCLASSPNDPDHATSPFTGHGVSWTKLSLSANTLGGTHALSVWVANAGASPSSAACTAQWTSNRTGCALIEFEVNGADLSGGASAAIVQKPTTTGTGTGTGDQSLSAAGQAQNRPLAFFVHLANEATTPRANWTETTGADGNFNNPATGVEGSYRSDAFETTYSATWTTSSAWRAVALEIKAAAVSGTSSPNLPKPTASFTGNRVDSGAIASSLPLLTASMAGQKVEAGTSAISLPKPTAALSGSLLTGPSGSLASNLPLLTSSLSGLVIDAHGPLSGGLPLAVLDASGIALHSGTLAGNLPKPVALLTGLTVHHGTAVSNLPKPTSLASGIVAHVSSFSAPLPLITASLTGQKVESGAWGSDLPKPVAVISGAVGEATVGVLSASLFAPAAAMQGQSAHVGSFAASIPVPIALFAGQKVESSVAAWVLPMLTGAFVGQRGHQGTFAVTLPVIGASIVGVVHQPITPSPRRLLSVESPSRSHTVPSRTSTISVPSRGRV